MRPIEIEFQAFGPYKNATKVDFESLTAQGVFLICGNTGSGKTTILDAMMFALYGECTNKGRGGLHEMRCSYAEKRVATEVRFDFEHKGETYRFTRRVTNAGAPTAQAMKQDGDNWVPMIQNPNPSNVGDLSEKLIGLNAEQFRQVIILPQGQFEKLLTAKVTDKEAILTKIFDAGKWDRIMEIFSRSIHDRVADLEEKKKRIEQSLMEEDCETLEELGEKIRHIESDKEQQKKDFETSDVKKQLEEWEKRLTLLERVSEQEGEFQKRKEAKERASEEKKNCEEQKKEIQEKTAQHKKKKEEIDKQQTTKTKYEEKREDYRNIDLITEEYNDKNREAEAAAEAEKNTKNKLEKKKERTVKLQEEMRDMKTRYDKLQTLYWFSAVGMLREELRDGERCKVCGAVYHADEEHVMEEDAVGPDERISREQLEEEKKKLDEKEKAFLDETEACEKLREDLEAKKTATSQCREALAVAVNKLQLTREKMVSGIETLEELEQAIGGLEKQISDYEKETERLADEERHVQDAYQKANTSLELAEKEVVKAKESLEKTTKEVKQSLAADGWESEDLPDVEEIQERIDEYDEAIRKHTESMAVMDDQIRRLTDKHKDLSKKEEGLSEALIRAEEDAGIARELRGETSLGLKRYILSVKFSTVVNATNQMLAKALGGRYHLYCSDDRQKNSRKLGLNLKVLDKMSEDEEGRFADTLSGGEKFLVSLALAIGMSMAAGSSGNPIEALFVDEGFGSLDANAVTDAMKILEYIRQFNAVVGIISHVELLQERIATKLVVEGTEEGSRILQTIG